MSRPRDLHERIRGAVYTTLAAAASLTPPDAGLVGPDGKAMPGHIQDELNVELVDKPCWVCFYAAAELPRGGSNGRDDFGYPTSVVLLGTGPASAPATEKPSLSRFRATLAGLFHMRRLAGVAEVLWCELAPDAPVVSEQTKNLDQIRTGLAVLAVTRTGRG